MGVNYVKAEPRALRDLGLDERWLQDRIEEDPSILGLGDVSIITRERRQRTGGRIDFLMYDPEAGDLRYEIEVMLGRLDESHIIRTIEYWDLERQRYPALRHRAVIVAEDITSRFFNVIGLLNRAIPIIAIQLNAFQIEDRPTPRPAPTSSSSRRRSRARSSKKFPGGCTVWRWWRTWSKAARRRC